ncbi:hypothetical protein PM082_013701 [Marasmius tenuissimus]|nr:hypothetical protein PM082_013701 [Marasmius tenuissimus]
MRRKSIGRVQLPACRAAGWWWKGRKKGQSTICGESHKYWVGGQSHYKRPSGETAKHTADPQALESGS